MILMFLLIISTAANNIDENCLDSRYYGSQLHMFGPLESFFESLQYEIDDQVFCNKLEHLMHLRTNKMLEDLTNGITENMKCVEDNLQTDFCEYYLKNLKSMFSRRLIPSRISNRVSRRVISYWYNNLESDFKDYAGQCLFENHTKLKNIDDISEELSFGANFNVLEFNDLKYHDCFLVQNRLDVDRERILNEAIKNPQLFGLTKNDIDTFIEVRSSSSFLETTDTSFEALKKEHIELNKKVIENTLVLQDSLQNTKPEKYFLYYNFDNIFNSIVLHLNDENKFRAEMCKSKNENKGEFVEFVKGFIPLYSVVDSLDKLSVLEHWRMIGLISKDSFDNSFVDESTNLILSFIPLPSLKGTFKMSKSATKVADEFIDSEAKEAIGDIMSTDRNIENWRTKNVDQILSLAKNTLDNINTLPREELLDRYNLITLELRQLVMEREFLLNANGDSRLNTNAPETFLPLSEERLNRYIVQLRAVEVKLEEKLFTSTETGTQ